MSTVSDDAGPRPYGEERHGDVFPRACVGSQCRMARFNSNGYGCPNAGDGSCRLEASPMRADRVRGTYLDCRRSILQAMTPQNGLTAVVTCSSAPGLPANDPMTFTLQSLRPAEEVGKSTPRYVVLGEGMQVDGPHGLTLISLRARLDQKGIRGGRGSSAGNPSGRR